jgi:F-type H+-transporting ATPase subunit b
MADMSVTVLAAEEGGTSNFLVPNGTFYFMLGIFLIVLFVIGTFVVPPVMRVLHERDVMINKTVENSREAARQFEAAQADYEDAMDQARKEATGVREEARAEGRKIIDGMRGRANEESAAALDRAGQRLKQESEAIAADLRRSAESMSATLASRVLGVEVDAKPSVTTARG